MTEQEFYDYFNQMKVGDQAKTLKKLGKVYNNSFQKVMQKIMNE